MPDGVGDGEGDGGDGEGGEDVPSKIKWLIVCS